MTEPIKAAIYARVSTEEQAEDDKVSLTVQREKAEAYCRAHDWEAVELYEDAGVSGAKADRPALTRLLADAREGKFQRVVFLKLDRLGRSLRDLLNLSHQLDELGVGIVSVHDSFDTRTPSGRLFFGILGAVAEFERELIAERSMMGKRGAAKRGHYNTGLTAFGFDYDPATRKLVVNENEAAVVRRVFSMYAREGLSQAKIAERLNAEGVPTKTLQTRSSDGVKKGWWKGQIARVLKNPIYKGEAYYGKTSMNGRGSARRRQPQPEEEWVRIECPEIVSEELWDAVQTRSERVRRRPQSPGERKGDFLLSGLARCEPCGRPMYGYTLRKRRRGELKTWRYLYCSGQHRYGYDCRDPERVNAERIEGPVLEAVIEAFSDPERVIAACHAYGEQLRAAESEQEGVIADLRRKLEGVAAARDRVVALFAKETITEADLTRQLAALDGEADEWQVELSRLEEVARQRETAHDLEKAARAIAGQIRPTIDEMTVDEKKTLLRALVERVSVGREGEITIECAVPGLVPEAGEDDYIRGR